MLLEQPQVDYYVIARLTPWDVNLMNSLWSSPALMPLPDENTASFYMERGSYEFSMPAGSAHGNCMLCMLPSFLERELGADAPCVMQAVEGRLDLSHALELRTALRAITPERALRAGAQPFFRAKALEALGALASLVCDKNEMPRHASESSSISTRVRQLLSASLVNPPTLDELARALGLSRTTLCTKFRAQTGMSVRSCLNALRMEEAKAHLRETDASVADIAAAVGYHNPAAFSTAFKRATGTTPHAWRQAIPAANNSTS